MTTSSPSRQDLAGMIDHSLLHPALSDAELEAGCQLAAREGVASVCVKPYAVAQAAHWLKGSSVRVGCVVGFPHGSNATPIKQLETEQACRDGAVEIDMVLNLGKAMSGDWDYVEQDIRAVCKAAHNLGAKVKVILENDFLAQGGAGLDASALKTKLCRLAQSAGADWVKTSTGFGYVKQPNGDFNYRGATEADLVLMRQSVQDPVQVKAAGGVRDLAGLLRVRELGCTRLGTSATQSILADFDRHLAAGLPLPSPSLGSPGGY